MPPALQSYSGSRIAYVLPSIEEYIRFWRNISSRSLKFIAIPGLELLTSLTGHVQSVHLQGKTSFRFGLDCSPKG